MTTNWVRCQPVIFSVILFAIAANSDNLSVGISYGVKRRYVKWWHNVTIAMVTTGITVVALAAAHGLRRYLFPNAPSWLSGALLMLLAIGSAYKQPQTDLPTGLNREPTTFGESLYLALALSVNNIGLALAGGLGDLSYGLVSTAIFGFSIAMLAAGQIVGSRLVADSGLLSHPLLGNGVLFLAGIMMLAGL
jgi:putative Mn2+ efflux pump MntP